MKDYIDSVLKSINMDCDLDSLKPKEKKKASKKLKRLLKELEYLKRTGGLTVITESNTIITTYHNNSLDRKKNSTNKKVVY